MMKVYGDGDGEFSGDGKDTHKHKYSWINRYIKHTHTQIQLHKKAHKSTSTRRHPIRAETQVHTPMQTHTNTNIRSFVCIN